MLRTVAERFNRESEPDMVACHYDGDKTNARLDNLRWDTRKANAADDVRNGVRSDWRWHPNAKLTEYQVLMIRWRGRHRKYGVAIKLAREFGVLPGTIRSILNRKTWKYLPPSSFKPERHVRRWPVGSADSEDVREGK